MGALRKVPKFITFILEDELLKEYSDLSVKNVVGRQYIPLDTHKEYIPVETHNIVYMDSNSSTFSSRDGSLKNILLFFFLETDVPVPFNFIF